MRYLLLGGNMRALITSNRNFLFWLLAICIEIADGIKPTSNHFGYEYPCTEDHHWHLSQDVINSAFAKADQIISARRKEERRRVTEGRILNEAGHRSEVLHQKFLMTFPRAMELDTRAERFEEASKIVTSGEDLSVEQIIHELRQRNLTSRLTQQCLGTFRNNCVPSKYRTFDGSCNNLQHPEWGKTFTCLKRILTPAYSDGLSSPRTGLNGPLPSAREISVSVHKQIHHEPSKTYTHFLMVWGQFLDHDITLTPLSRTSDNRMIQCCPLRNDNNEQCFPIPVSRDDYFYSHFGRRCLNFVRSSRCPLCLLGPREQINQLTAFVDASHIYGTTVNASNQLRSNRGGKLVMVSLSTGAQLLPPSPNPETDTCSRPAENRICFRAGDVRLNQHPALTGMHTIWAREHNRIADVLQFLNPNWTDENLFQEARRILGAEMQIVTWSEFLPVVLGEEYMDYYYLNVNTKSYTQYSTSVDPTLFNEFVTAAYRFGHSLIDDIFNTIKFKGDDSGFRLSDNFFYPFELYNGSLDGLVRGATRQPSQKFDSYIVESVTNHLHQRRGNNSGLDLAATNVQRGRDHGLPGYTAYVNRIFGMNINSFSDLRQLMKPQIVDVLQKTYNSVHDIDLFTGGISELPVGGGVVGSVFAAIIGEQFYRLKYGDRYYFEHSDQVGSFTPEQLRELRKVSLSRIICDNTNIRNIQRNVFRPPSFQNPIVPCSKLTSMNLDIVCQ